MADATNRSVEGDPVGVVLGTVYLLAGSVVLGHAVLQMDLWCAARRASLRRAREGPRESPCVSSESAPRVVVQLPVFNECQVVERLLTAVSRLKYPTGRLSVQVLDDSTDETTALIDRWLRVQVSPHGAPEFEHVRRGTRDGYKAGALAEALRAASSAEFVAVFDADFVPPEDFLARTVPYFADPLVAVVQSRWGHLNPGASWLTRAQATMLDNHFAVEQAGRLSIGAFGAFNGSAGVLRASAVLAVGGWRATTLTEDFDLSLRLQLAGWRVVYDASVVSPAELPQDLAAFRIQQHRWMRGVAQNARVHLSAATHSGLPLRQRAHLVGQIAETSTFTALAVQLLLAPPVAIATASGTLPVWVGVNLPLVFGFTALVPAYAYSSGHGQVRHVRVRRGQRLLRFAEFLLLSMGMTLHNAVAVVAGWTGRQAAFERTPKRGTATPGRPDEQETRRRRAPVVAEWALAAVVVTGSLAALTAQPAATPYLWPVAGWVLGAVALVSESVRRRAQQGETRTESLTFE